MGCRPNIPEHMPDEFQKLMSQCWDTDAEKRPTFEEVLKRLQVGACHTRCACPEDVNKSHLRLWYLLQDHVVLPTLSQSAGLEA